MSLCRDLKAGRRAQVHQKAPLTCGLILFLFLGLVHGGPGVRRFRGTLTVMSGDMPDDPGSSSDIVYMLHQPKLALYDLIVPPSLDHDAFSSGELVVVTGTLIDPNTIQVVSIEPAPLERAVISRSMAAVDVAAAAASAAAAVAQVAASAAALLTATGIAGASGDDNATDAFSALRRDGPVKPAMAAALASTLINTRLVAEVPSLFMILSICGYPAAASKEELEQILFAGPSSSPLTLEGYFYECSRGRSAMSRANSLVVGPVVVPCSFSGAYRFNTTSCAYRDAWGWQTWAQQYVANEYGIDLNRYRHRVAVLPIGFTNAAGCPWIGLGTLGPVERGTDGSYISSMAWIQGESSRDVMAFFHEMGHNLYLHHANDSNGCEYCDWSSVMGGCCAVRCHNAPHNWQLGWGAPLAVLTTATLPAGTFLYFSLPSQHAADAHILWVQPDWTAGGRRDLPFPVSYYLSYRIDSGKYDAAMPEVYLYATNIYFWDGQTQITVRRSRHVAAVFTGEEYRSLTDGWVVRQLSHAVSGARVGVCRFTEERETSCKDGLDNDCDGLPDNRDPDCGEPLKPPLPPAPPPGLQPPPAPPPLPGSDPMDAMPPGIWNNEWTPPPPPGSRVRPSHPMSPPPPSVPPRPPPPPSPAGNGRPSPRLKPFPKFSLPPPSPPNPFPPPPPPPPDPVVPKPKTAKAPPPAVSPPSPAPLSPPSPKPPSPSSPPARSPLKQPPPRASSPKPSPPKSSPSLPSPAPPKPGLSPSPAPPKPGLSPSPPPPKPKPSPRLPPQKASPPPSPPLPKIRPPPSPAPPKIMSSPRPLPSKASPPPSPPSSPPPTARNPPPRRPKPPPPNPASISPQPRPSPPSLTALRTPPPRPLPTSPAAKPPPPNAVRKSPPPSPVLPQPEAGGLPAVRRPPSVPIPPRPRVAKLKKNRKPKFELERRESL